MEANIPHVYEFLTKVPPLQLVLNREQLGHCVGSHIDSVVTGDTVVTKGTGVVLSVEGVEVVTVAG